MLCFCLSEDIFPCKDCGIWYRSERNLQAHLMYYCASRQKPPSTAASPPQDKPKESYPNERLCPFPQCNKSCPSASSLEIHMRTHSGKSAAAATRKAPPLSSLSPVRLLHRRASVCLPRLPVRLHHQSQLRAPPEGPHGHPEGAVPRLRLRLRHQGHPLLPPGHQSHGVSARLPRRGLLPGTGPSPAAPLHG